LYIPKINLPVEGVEHARWLEKGRLLHDRQIEELFKLVRNGDKSNAVTARATDAGPTKVVTGVPMPPLLGGVLRGTPPTMKWTYEWQGLLPEYYVTLDSVAGGSYTVGELGLPGDPAASVALLPPVLFDDGGTTMRVVSSGDYPDSIGGGQTPIYLSVDVMPSFDGEEFRIYPPDPLNFNGLSVPFYKFQLTNPTAFTAVVNVSGGGVIFDESAMYYAGTRVPVMGSTTDWSVEPGAFLAWHVEVHRGWGATATPIAYNDAGTVRFSDPFFDANVAASRFMFPFAAAGVLTVAPVKGSHFNDSGADTRIGKVRATVDTAPTGADIELDVLVGGVSVLTSPLTIVAGQTTGTVVPPVGLWPAGDPVTVEITQIGSTVAGSDLTVQVWAG
jgi:hypothetical protein